MESNETKTLWLSVGAALFAVFLLYSWSQEQKAAMHKKFGTKKSVVIAAKDITEMQVIDESMLEVIEMPVDFIQPGSLQNPEKAIGQMAAAPLKKGEQMMNTKLLLPNSVTGLSRQVSPGKRAMTLPVDEMRGVAKLVKPGDRIDIIIAMDSGQGESKKREVRNLMQDVPVLAVGQNIIDTVPVQIEEDGDDSYVLTNLRKVTNFTSITVEASPEETLQLTYILTTNPGNLIVTLRNPNDQEKRTIRTISSNDVLGKVRVRKVASKPVAIKTPSKKPKKPKKRKPRKRGGYEEI